MTTISHSLPLRQALKVTIEVVPAASQASGIDVTTRTNELDEALDLVTVTTVPFANGVLRDVTPLQNGNGMRFYQLLLRAPIEEVFVDCPVNVSLTGV